MSSGKTTATNTPTTTITMLHYDFMRTAFAAAAIVALVAGPIGYFLVLRGQTFAGHALAHVGFTGATGAILVGLSPLAGLVFLTVIAGIAMGFLGERLAQRDVAIGIVLALALGLGLLFLHFFTAFATQATALLFGNVLAVDIDTVWTLLALGVVSLAVLAVISRPLLFVSVQPELAVAKGVPARALSITFLAIVALATAECAQIVGVLLVFALMVGPAATAQRLTKNIASGLALAAALALADAWLGLTLAFYTDWPTSFWIAALSAAGYFLVVLPWARWLPRRAAMGIVTAKPPVPEGIASTDSQPVS
jgi:zinc/manganese transport system permease protein